MKLLKVNLQGYETIAESENIDELVEILNTLVESNGLLGNYTIGGETIAKTAIIVHYQDFDYVIVHGIVASVRIVNPIKELFSIPILLN